MPRPFRREFPGALYHITSRGDRKEAIYADDADRMAWLATLADVCLRFNFVVHSFCQMTNHYHLLLETIDGNLAQGMRQLNGVYSQYFNRRYKLVGHLLQGRYHAVLVQQGSHLLELSRYVVLNPVRAGLVASLEEWRWSSHPFVLTEVKSPPWLRIDWILACFGATRAKALPAYQRFLLEGVGKASPLAAARCRDFVLPLAWYAAAYPKRDEAMARAYLSSKFSMAEVGSHFKVSARTVSRAVERLADVINRGQVIKVDTD